MSRFKKLKSLFITEDENAPKAAAEKQSKAEVKTKQQANTKATSNAATPSSNVKGVVKPQFTERLLKIIDDNNQEGFDYLEFKQTLKGMSKMSMEESIMFKSAYAAAQAMGTSPTKLVESIQQYLQVLEKEEKSFLEAIKHQTEKNVGGRKQALKDAEASLKQKEAQIKKLQAEIEADNQQLAKTRTELTQVTAKIDVTKSDFLASYNKLKSQMMDDVKKINQYLS